MTFDIYVPPTKSIALYVFMGVEGTMLFLWFDRREDICGHDEEGTYDCVSYELIEIKVVIHFLNLVGNTHSLMYSIKRATRSFDEFVFCNWIVKICNCFCVIEWTQPSLNLHFYILKSELLDFSIFNNVSEVKLKKWWFFSPIMVDLRLRYDISNLHLMKVLF